MEGVVLTPEHFPQEMGLSKELCSLGVSIMQWLEGQVQDQVAGFKMQLYYGQVT